MNSEGETPREEQPAEETPVSMLPTTSFVRWFGPVRVESRKKFRWYGPVRVPEDTRVS